MKIVIVGTNHAGIACANTLLKQYNEHEVVLLDRNTNLSYLGCGTALVVGRQVQGFDGLFYERKETLEEKGARISLETPVTPVDFEQKIVYAKDINGNELEESYDKLVLATGSKPIAPNLPGNDLDGIHYLKLYQEGKAVDVDLDRDDVQNVAVIGAGYIGVEIAEAAKRRGKNVRLFDAADTSLSNYYDKNFATKMDSVLQENGIETHFEELATGYEGDENGRVRKVTTTKGEYEADLVVNAIGFIPNNDLGKDHLELFGNGAYLVDLHQQTSDPDVYAIGDCATLYSNASQQTEYIALASNAVRSGLVAGHNLGGTAIKSRGVQGSNGISIFGYNMVSTGLSVKAAERRGLEVEYTDYSDLQRPAFMEENDEVQIRIVYEKESRRIIGAQMASMHDMSMGIHMFSLAIDRQETIDELALLDLFFLPHFNQPYNYVTLAALTADK